MPLRNEPFLHCGKFTTKVVDGKIKLLKITDTLKMSRIYPANLNTLWKYRVKYRSV